MSETDAQSQQPMTVLAQYIRDLSFENPNAPDSMRNSDDAPKVSVSVDVGARHVENNIFECTIGLSVEADRAEKRLYMVELAYGGLFAISGVRPEHVEPMILIEAPRFLFPFVRAIIGDTIREGGFPPIMLQPIDFAALFRQRKSREQEGEGATALA